MNELKTISIDGVEHDFTTFTDLQKAKVMQINDLNQKLAAMQMQAEQLSVARDAFVGMLKSSLELK